MPAPSEVWIASSREELLAGAERREVVTPGDGKSGSVFEFVTIDGQRYFAKTLGYRTDWIMRVTGDRDLRPLKIWRAGIMSGAPAEVDHAVVGMAADGENEDALLTILIARHRRAPDSRRRHGDPAPDARAPDRRPGCALRAVLGLARRHLAHHCRGASAVLRPRQHRGRGGGRRPAGADRSRHAGLAPRRRVESRVGRVARGGPCDSDPAGRRDARDARNVPAR